MQGVALGCRGYSEVQKGAEGCSEVQWGAGGCGGVLPTAPLRPHPFCLSRREKTSCIAWRWHMRSQHSLRVSRIYPVPGCWQPQGSRRCLHCLPHGHPPCLPVTQCWTEGSTRGLGTVPRLALDVMACEVLRVLQLTDTALVPISYVVPRKVRGGLQVALCHPRLVPSQE